MSKVKFDMDHAGVRALLRSQEATGVVLPYAQSIAGRAGEGFEVTTYVGRNRVNASVHAATFEARKSNFENNTLLKAMGGGK
jgi:hypothetical protein